MPLTAHLADRGLLDATLPELGCSAAVPWESIYRTRPRATLTCRDCDQPMHAKISHRGARFFAHDRRSPHCPSAGETAEHRAFKKVLAQAARAAGCEAELEVTAEHRGWRADVLVTSPEGRRTALEAQLSSVARDEVLERTSRYEQDGVDVVWFTPRAARWLGDVPSAGIHRPSTQAPWLLGEQTVWSFILEDCYCHPLPPWDRDHPSVHANWSRRHNTRNSSDLSVGDFVREVLHGRLVPLEESSRFDRYRGWATPEDLETAAAQFPPPEPTTTTPPPPETPHVPDEAASEPPPWYQQWPDIEQQRLLGEAKAWVRHHTLCAATARPTWSADWIAGGLPLSRPIPGDWSHTIGALIRPDPTRIDWDLLPYATLPVIVGSQQERDALAATAPSHARIVVLSANWE
ncbi:competence protein CoiA [Streptomyces noursei]|uniref:competence protein CoiA n=1 Tax=Streptomyces noursei TaxID=1971 RepID=UPI000C9BF5A7|nr:competence protein CoiA family protein [Streptomyces noursei]